MSDFDYDKIKDMEYDQDRKCYVGKNGEEFHVTPFSNGSGYKYDYYDKSPYGNAPHNSTHVKSDLNENWSRTDNDRDNETQDKSSGIGCYLTTACMKHYLDEFDDNCYELRVLRWFRDNYVNSNDIEHYYNIAPYIVEGINKEENPDMMYNYVYDNIVDYCVEKIQNFEFEEAYNRYKDSIINFENLYNIEPFGKKLIKTFNK